MLIDAITPSNAIELLDLVNPFMWQHECEATRKMRSNSFKQINSILVHHDAMLWLSFHDSENWDYDIDECRDDNGVIVTEYRCSIDYDKHNTYIVLSYYGAYLDEEAYDY